MDLFPTAYFGSIAYFRALVNAKNPIIETKEHFIKQTCRSRCTILGANGIQQLSIPVIRKNGSKTSIDEVEISDENWQKIHWKSIESAYASAPYFEAYDREVKALIFQKETNLLKFNQVITEEILSLLDLDFTVNFTEKYSAETCKKNHLAIDFEAATPIKKYIQVFSENSQFHSNLSILDLLFNEGPMARNWLTKH